MWPLLLVGAALGGGFLFLRNKAAKANPSGAAYNDTSNPDPLLPGNTILIPGPGGVPRWKVIKQGVQNGSAWWQLWAMPNAFNNPTELFVLRYVDVPHDGRYFGGKGGDATERVIQVGMSELGVRPAYPPGM